MLASKVQPVQLLNAQGFRFIYENGTYPTDSSYFFNYQKEEISGHSNKISREWDFIVSKLVAMAHSLTQKEVPSICPPDFPLIMMYQENIQKLRKELNFKVVVTRCDFKFDAFLCCVSF